MPATKCKASVGNVCVFRQRQKPSEATRSNSNCCDGVSAAPPPGAAFPRRPHEQKSIGGCAKRERKQRKRKAARANKRARADGDEALPPPATSPSPTSTSSAHAGACAAADFDFEHVDDDVFDYIRDQGAEAALAAERAGGRARGQAGGHGARRGRCCGLAGARGDRRGRGRGMVREQVHEQGRPVLVGQGERARRPGVHRAEAADAYRRGAAPGYIGVRSRLPSFSYPKVPSSTNCAFELRMCAR